MFTCGGTLTLGSSSVSYNEYSPMLEGGAYGAYMTGSSYWVNFYSGNVRAYTKGLEQTGRMTIRSGYQLKSWTPANGMQCYYLGTN